MNDACEGRTSGTAPDPANAATGESPKLRRNRMRRAILEFIYEKYQEDPIRPVMLLELAERLGEPKEAVVPHLRYLESSGLVRIAWNLSGTGLIRVTKDGLDVAEDDRLKARHFPLAGEDPARELTKAGEAILRRIDGREELPPRDRLFLGEVAAELYAAIRRMNRHGLDFHKLVGHLEILRGGLPQLDKELRESLRFEEPE